MTYQDPHEALRASLDDATRRRAAAIATNNKAAWILPAYDCGKPCWLRDMSRDDARILVAGLADTAAGALPARANDCRRLCAVAAELLEQEGERPFSNPLYWAAFFVVGDEAITADGVDPRVLRHSSDVPQEGEGLGD